MKMKRYASKISNRRRPPSSTMVMALAVPCRTLLKLLFFQCLLICLSWWSLSYYVHRHEGLTNPGDKANQNDKSSFNNNAKARNETSSTSLSATLVELHSILHNATRSIWILLTGGDKNQTPHLCTLGGITTNNNNVENVCSRNNSTTSEYTCDGDTTKQNDEINQTNNGMINAHEVLKIMLSSSNLERLDDTLPTSMNLLKERRAHLCWHKHSTFLEHLVNVHHILRLWGQSTTMGRVGLFHSAYSNSYVNLALLDPNNITERQILQDTIGTQAEELVYLYCNINRQSVVVDTLLQTKTIPPKGLTVPHLRDSSQDVYLSPMFLQTLLIFTMADIADQYFGWQDELFPKDSSMLKTKTSTSEHHNPQALWPGESRPGLWMHYVSSLCEVVSNYQTQNSHDDETTNNDNDVLIPPVFHNCTVTITEENERLARDYYWEVMSDGNYLTTIGTASNDATDIDTMNVRKKNDEMVLKLELAIEANPFIFEPLVSLGQLYMYLENFDDATRVLIKALQLQEQWGTAWDKRMSFGAWRAWTKVLTQRAEQRLSWPTNSWDVNNFGLVLED